MITRLAATVQIVFFLIGDYKSRSVLAQTRRPDEIARGGGLRGSYKYLNPLVDHSQVEDEDHYLMTDASFQSPFQDLYEVFWDADEDASERNSHSLRGSASIKRNFQASHPYPPQALPLRRARDRKQKSRRAFLTVVESVGISYFAANAIPNAARANSFHDSRV
jgi:hypothetical protein